MGTPFDDILDLAMITISDRQIDVMYEKNEYVAYKYMVGLLIKATSSFYSCRQSLEYYIEVDTEGKNRYFYTSELTLLERNILSNLVIIEWYNRKIQDTTSITEGLQGRDKKIHAKAPIAKQKSEDRDKALEKLSNQISQYQLLESGFVL